MGITVYQLKALAGVGLTRHTVLIFLMGYFAIYKKQFCPVKKNWTMPDCLDDASCGSFCVCIIPDYGKI